MNINGPFRPFLTGAFSANNNFRKYNLFLMSKDERERLMKWCEKCQKHTATPQAVRTLKHGELSDHSYCSKCGFEQWTFAFKGV